MKILKNRLGFTLLEMTIVTAIVGVFLVVASSVVKPYIAESQKIKNEDAIRVTDKAIKKVGKKR